MVRICVLKVCTRRYRHTHRRHLLHYRKNPWVDLERVKRYLGIYQSSSPSYVLMAGIDRCTRIFTRTGKPHLFAAFEQQLHDFYQSCENLQYISVFPENGNDDGILG